MLSNYDLYTRTPFWQWINLKRFNVSIDTVCDTQINELHVFSWGFTLLLWFRSLTPNSTPDKFGCRQYRILTWAGPSISQCWIEKILQRQKIWYIADCNDKNSEAFLHGLFSVPMTQCSTAKKISVSCTLSIMTSKIDFVQKYGQTICHETV